MAIPRGTTPTFILTTTNQLVDWTLADHIYVAFYQERKRAGCHGNWNNRVTKTEEDVDIDKQSIAVYFSQEETLSFDADSDIQVQVNWTYGDGQRGATQIARVRFGENLIRRVLE